MTIYGSLIAPFSPNTVCSSYLKCGTPCLDKLGCPQGVCPDFEVRRYDTEPPFILSVSDCNGPLDLADSVVEVNMWAKAKLKTAINSVTTTLSFSESIGFEQVQVGDIILVDRKRNPEQMVITSFDEDEKTLQVQRGFANTIATSYTKGTGLRIFRILNGVGETNMVRENVEQLDGTVETGVLTDAQLLYHWQPENTCLPGCYYFEWKLLKIQRSLFVPTAIVDSVVIEVLGKKAADAYSPTFTLSPQCQLSGEVESVRRFPLQGEGYLVKIIDSPTFETLG